jgi:hypothetical protein
VGDPADHDAGGRHDRQAVVQARGEHRGCSGGAAGTQARRVGRDRLPAPTVDTVAGWIEQFLAQHDVEPSTLSGYRQALRQRIEHPTIGIGRIKLQKLTAVRLDCFYRDLKTRATPRPRSSRPTGC